MRILENLNVKFLPKKAIGKTHEEYLKILSTYNIKVIDFEKYETFINKNLWMKVDCGENIKTIETEPMWKELSFRGDVIAEIFDKADWYDENAFIRFK